MLDSLTAWLQHLHLFSSSNFTPILDYSDGGQDEFDAVFEATSDASGRSPKILGEGEFGVVTQVQSLRRVQQAGDNEISEREYQSFACKTLRKGVVFKDNIFYSPLSPTVLQTEIDCLRVLKGNNHCLLLRNVFETPSTILLVTELCEGGDLRDYQLQHKQREGTQALPIATVASIAFQLLSAVSHCAQHGIIHRDIKPQHLMLTRSTSSNVASTSNGHKNHSTSSFPSLRLIDFGCSAIHCIYSFGDGVDLPTHSTYAGSAFYQSPEMFQKTYTQKTDVWSACVVTYVAAAGYPEDSDSRQRIFNQLISSTPRTLECWTQELGIPSASPQNALVLQQISYPKDLLDLLDSGLTYRHRRRPNAKDLLSSKFVQSARIGNASKKPS